MALVFVLWVMTILCALAVQMRFTSHLRLQATAYTGMSTKAHYLSRAGIAHAIADLDYEGYTLELTDEYYIDTDDDEQFCNVQLGDGTYTLYAGMDSNGEPIYGMIDEAARINVNVVERKVLQLVPGVDPELARLIEKGKKRQPYADLSDLLNIQGMDTTILYGEDQNENGLLDPNENDGDLSWPPDNEDGQLDQGLAAYLTTWSAAKNVTFDGQERVDISKASAKDISDKVDGISEQQGHSIVAHRDKNKFESIADLLNVDLVELVKKKDSNNNSNSDRNSNNNNPNRNDSRNDGSKDDNKKNAKKKDENKQEYKSTGKKAFDLASLKSFADSLTISEEEILKGVVNINEASAEVLACLPKLSEALAAEIVTTRLNSEEQFKSTAELLDIQGMSTSIFKSISPMISVRSDVFTIRSFGVVGDVYVCNAAVIDRTEDETKIVYWREIE